MLSKKEILTACWLFTAIICFGQSESIVIVIPNYASSVSLDGTELGSTEAASAYRITTVPGEHYIEVKAVIKGVSQSKGEVVTLEGGKQKILRIDFIIEQQIVQAEPVLIADLNISIPGSLEAIAWAMDNPDKPYPYPEFYYAFEKGDHIIVNASMSNKKGTNHIAISTYPDGVQCYSNNAFTALNEVKIIVPNRSIYRFVLGSNHVLPRNCFITLKRIPADAKAAFNPTVTLKEILTPVVIHEPQEFFINGGRAATFSGGRSRIILPITLPKNTLEWYYRFSASRSEEDIKSVRKNFSLFGDLASLVLNLSGTAVVIKTLAVGSLSTPPGANYCEIYLLTQQTSSAFEAKQDTEWQYYREGSRQNFKSGNVKVTGMNAGTYHLGIRNPDPGFGIHVSVEVVAITARKDYIMEQH